MTRTPWNPALRPGRLAAYIVIALAFTWSVGTAGAAEPTYHTHAELASALGAAVAAHPDLATLVSIGKSRGGRDIWAVEIAVPRGIAPAERPALLVAANLEGDHLVGSEIALGLVEALLNGYPADAAIKDRLERYTVYVVPRVNPDGAEQMFAPVKTGARTNLTPYDADNDARMDEDGPEDLNKDGVITVMRVKDPAGPYMISPDDSRLMKKADPAKGETGGWAIYAEGLDNDGDGFINEDGPGGVDINRNFMHQYPYFATDAGRYMVSEAETRALLDYVLKHRNIAAILTFGESDNLMAAQPRATTISLLDFAAQSTSGARTVGLFQDAPMGRRGMGMGMGMPDDPPSSSRPVAASAYRMPTRQTITTINAADTEYLKTIADKYRELTGLRNPGATRAPAGAFYEYGYFQYGVPSFSTPGWSLPGATTPAASGTGRPAGSPASPSPAPAGIPAGMGMRGGAPSARGAADPAAAPESIDQRLLQWMDAEKIDGFASWTPFTHPTLGAVEIGGFKPYVTVNPPAAKLADLAAAHTKFVVYLTSLFPSVRITKAEASTLATGVYRVKAEIENAGFLPTALAHAVSANAVLPTVVQLGVPPEAIVTGAEKTVYVPTLPGSGGRQSFDWVITARAGTTVTLKVNAQKGGTASTSITLK
jgi:hypothetical protein